MITHIKTVAVTMSGQQWSLDFYTRKLGLDGHQERRPRAVDLPAPHLLRRRAESCPSGSGLLRCHPVWELGGDIIRSDSEAAGGGGDQVVGARTFRLTVGPPRDILRKTLLGYATVLESLDAYRIHSILNGNCHDRLRSLFFVV